MTTTNRLFLDALGASLRGSSVCWDGQMDPSVWQELFHMAQIHKVLPMIFRAVYRCPAAERTDPAVFAPYKQQVKQLVMLQTVKTEAALNLLNRLQAAGVEPIVVKGLICRELYPQSDERISSDEDLLIEPDQFELCHRVLLESGMAVSDPEADILSAFEVPYRSTSGPLFIELHKQLFPPESEAYGEWNRFFEGVHRRSIICRIRGREVRTMCQTDHLFYLLCHGLKHFLHSGFGIRQVCDICLFANAHRDAIDWQQVRLNCREIRAEKFAAALMRIGCEYLTLDPQVAAVWQDIPVDPEPLLEDLLDAGIYGDGTMSRKHSSTITLNAAAAKKTGKKTGVLRSLFPPLQDMTRRYPYLKSRPFLLPVAWADRIRKYRSETAKAADNSAAGAMQIGARRVKLLQEYEII